MNKSKKIIIFLLLISIIDTFALFIVCFVKKPKDVKVTQQKENMYEIRFIKNENTSVYVTINEKGFDSIQFRDNRRNQGLITFADEFNGYFSFFNADLDYAIDNRSSQNDDFKFQRIEYFEGKSYCYDVKYDENVSIKSIPLSNDE